MSQPTYFELVDVTGEPHQTLGVWLTLDEAIAALLSVKDPSAIGSDPEDVCKVEIRERPLGWSGAGQKVFERAWVREYKEASGNFEWRLCVPADDKESISPISQRQS